MVRADVRGCRQMGNQCTYCTVYCRAQGTFKQGSKRALSQSWFNSSRNLKSFETPQTYFQLWLNLRRDSHREHDPLLPGELVDAGSVAAAVVAGVGRVVVGDDVARVALVLDAVDAWRRRRHAAVAHSASFAPGRQQPKN